MLCPSACKQAHIPTQCSASSRDTPALAHSLSLLQSGEKTFPQSYSKPSTSCKETCLNICHTSKSIQCGSQHISASRVGKYKSHPPQTQRTTLGLSSHSQEATPSWRAGRSLLISDSRVACAHFSQHPSQHQPMPNP